MGVRFTFRPPRVSVPFAKQGDRPFRDLPEFTLWQTMARIAESDQPSLRRKLLQALTVDFSDREIRAIERSLAAGEIDAAIDQLKIDEMSAGVADALLDLGRTLNRAGAATARDLSQQVGTTVTFNQANPRAANWAEINAAEQVKNIMGPQRQALKDSISRSFRNGLGPQSIAREATQIVGLIPKHMTAVQNYRIGLEAREEFTPARIDSLVSTYERRLRFWRADNIARTETMRATAAGRNIMWEQATNDGTLVSSEWVREWVAIVPSDGRTCTKCQRLDGKRAPVGQPYPGGYMGSDGHPSCRCSERLIPADTPQEPPTPEDELTEPIGGVELKPVPA